MTGRVILFGATGFTGRLTAEAMARAGLAPVLAGRSADALVGLVGDLAGLAPIDAAPTWQVADAADPASVRALVSSPEDVLVSTVGPFVQWGAAAVDAAVDEGCAYLDSTGEAGFLHRLFDEVQPLAESTGARLVPAFGYDYVPGNLAAGLAVQDAVSAGGVPAIVEIGYFVRGPMQMSSGTRATVATMALDRPLAFRNGRVVTTAPAIGSFDVDGSRLDGLLVGSSEAFCVPRIDTRIRDVSVYLGWAGKQTKAVHRVRQVATSIARLPLVGRAVTAGASRSAGSATGVGPAAEARAKARTVVVARTRDGVGRVLSSARLEGPSPYDLTAELMAWGAAMMLTGHVHGPGVMGPVDAFGLAPLAAGCADIGLTRVA
jgi:short subunit dehydrogenase-like uncharacterized protein